VTAQCWYHLSNAQWPLLTFNRNSTASYLLSPPDTYSAHFQEISRYNVHLNTAEKAWAAWYTYMQNDVLATSLMSFTLHKIAYFGRSLP
jgi:methylsterol monooxygenase